MNSIDTLMELERKSYHKAMAKDFIWLKNLHAKNALMFTPGTGTAKASDIFAKRIKETGGKPQALSDTFPQFFWEPIEAFVSSSDDMGWVHGVITVTHEDGIVDHGKYVSVWVKEDGIWKVNAEIRNMNQ